MLNRRDLGLRMQNWHSSQNDPIYAVGSFYSSGLSYPDKAIVIRAIYNLQSDLSQFRRMVRGKVVYVPRNGERVDLKQFAGYTVRGMRKDINDLREIVNELEECLEKDYCNDNG